MDQTQACKKRAPEIYRLNRKKDQPLYQLGRHAKRHAAHQQAFSRNEHGQEIEETAQKGQPHNLTRLLTCLEVYSTARNLQLTRLDRDDCARLGGPLRLSTSRCKAV